MGQFSWITQDTNKSIRESYGCLKTKKTTAYLHDNKGNVWEENRYEGYGVFGGKDFYELMAEMNLKLFLNIDFKKDLDSLRSLGITLENLKLGGDTSYSLIEEKELEKAIESIDVSEIKSPNLTRHKDWSWINENPEQCPNQGWGK